MANRKSASVIRTEKLPFLVGAVLVLGLVAIGYKASQKKYFNPITSPQTNQTQTFTASSVMGGFTIEIPEGFEVEERNISLSLTKKDSEILITRSATNFFSLKDYISDLEAKNKVEPQTKVFSKINNYDAVTREIVEANQTRKVLTIYIDGLIYTLSTSNQILFSTIDQIAQSFQLPP